MRVTETNTLFFIYLTLLPIKISFLDNEVCVLILIAFLPKHTFSMIKTRNNHTFSMIKTKTSPTFPSICFWIIFLGKAIWAKLPTKLGDFANQFRPIWFPKSPDLLCR